MSEKNDQQVQKTLKQLKGLKYSKTSKTPDELLQQAEALVREKEQVDAINVQALFIEKEEKRKAVELLKKYISDYTIETISDKNTLSQLVYLEILNLRLQKALNEAQEKLQAVPSNTVDLIHRNIEQISKLKLSLGISKSIKDQNKQDGYATLQLIKKKFKKWLSENQASRTLWCAHCGKSMLLKIKTDIWEAQKHPFFKDRILGNEHLVNLYKAGKVTREDLAKVFEVSPDYIDWLVVKGWRLLSDADEKKLAEEASQKKIEKQVEGG